MRKDVEKLYNQTIKLVASKGPDQTMVSGLFIGGKINKFFEWLDNYLIIK